MKAGEGNPADPAQARMHMSIHDKVVGLLLVRLGDVPICIVLRTPPGEITCWNAEGTLAGRTDPGRQKQLLSRSVYRFGQRLTPRVRAMLCRHCNSGLGFFKDDPDLLQIAVEYLRTYAIEGDE